MSRIVIEIQGPRFDYAKQAWVFRGKYLRCGHPESMNCKCFGRIHEGEDAPQEESQS